MTSLLGIYREASCSPGRHRENDAAILDLVGAALESRGHHVVLSSPEDAPRFAQRAALIFSMSRAPLVLHMLSKWAAEGRAIVNRPVSVLATARSRLARRTLGAVSLPVAHLVSTARGLRTAAGATMNSGEWWVKGGDLYASRREDVQRVESMEALDRVLDDFERRGISTAVLQQHVRGREIKFYAVGAARFFHWLDTNDPSTRDGGSGSFQECAVAAGQSLSLDVFGGDLVIGDDGGVTLIDLNDWPSFAPCRDAAARAIAEHLEQGLQAAYTAVSPAGSVTPSASA
jgi:hypothetical protein